MSSFLASGISLWGAWLNALAHFLRRSLVASFSIIIGGTLLCFGRIPIQGSMQLSLYLPAWLGFIDAYWPPHMAIAPWLRPDGRGSPGVAVIAAESIGPRLTLATMMSRVRLYRLRVRPLL